MPSSKTKKPAELEKELLLQSFIVEYEKLRDEILQALGSEQQLIILVLASASFAIPLLIRKANSIPSSVITALFYALSLVYSIIALRFVYTEYAVGVIGRYINRYIEVEVNKILNTSMSNRVFHWETFVRRERKNPMVLFLATLNATSSLFIILIPNLATLMAAQYTSLLPRTSLINPATNFIESNISEMAVISWVLFLVSILAAISVVIYNGATERLARKQ